MSWLRGPRGARPHSGPPPPPRGLRFSSLRLLLADSSRRIRHVNNIPALFPAAAGRRGNRASAQPPGGGGGKSECATAPGPAPCCRPARSAAYRSWRRAPTGVRPQPPPPSPSPGHRAGPGASAVRAPHSRSQRPAGRPGRAASPGPRAQHPGRAHGRRPRGRARPAPTCALGGPEPPFLCSSRYLHEDYLMTQQGSPQRDRRHFSVFILALPCDRLGRGGRKGRETGLKKKKTSGSHDREGRKTKGRRDTTLGEGRGACARVRARLSVPGSRRLGLS